MPSPTSRGYPYPSTSSPATVPADIAALATAVNDDVQGVADLVADRLAVPSTIERASGMISSGGGNYSGGTYRILGAPKADALMYVAGVNQAEPFWLDDADYAVAGYVTKLRLRAVMMTTAVALGVDMKVDLKKVAGVSGDGVAPSMSQTYVGGTAGAVASTTFTGLGTNVVVKQDVEVAMPSGSGLHLFTVRSPSTPANNSGVFVVAELAVRHVPA
jgi:hypothetical protein